MKRHHFFVRAKDNPFCVQRVTTLPYQFQSGDWESNLQQLADLEYRAAIVGPQGSGKSTLLRDLANELTDRGFGVDYVFLPHDKAQHSQILCAIRSFNASSILLLDGVERLSVGNRFLLYRRTSRLVVTVHSRQILPPFRLPVWIQTRPTSATIDSLLEELGMHDPSTVAQAHQLFQAHSGNVRNVMRDLYDRCKYIPKSPACQNGRTLPPARKYPPF